MAVTDLGPLNDEIDALMGTLRAESRDIRVFFQVFATKLTAALPDVVEVEREGSVFARRRPVRRLTVRAGDDILEAEMTRDGLVCREIQVLNGLTDEIGFEAWLRLLAASLRQKARSTAEASAVLRALLT
ncbi:MAG TPA: hypothetical protein DCX12_13490 [Chloroflexi bacterium]|jgi:hypothetical protein|nr:hypothetical protein [Chloroflexota bacterium]HBV94643.1 hypothetical protein [Chloroflexota bacterium]